MNPVDDLTVGEAAMLPSHALADSTTIGLFLSGAKRLYTYQCQRPVEVGDRVNVKLPNGTICTQKVEEVHPKPQLSDKWETKWAVVVQTKAEYEAANKESSELGKGLGL